MKKSFNKKAILLILDGWGLAPPDKFNAVDNAKTPNFDKLVREYPNIRLKSDGPAVGLPEGQYGTSEINHQIIGAGRVIPQDLTRIDQEIESKVFFTNQTLVKACQHAIKHNSKLQIVGIISDGKVHSAMNHIKATIQLAKEQGVKKLHIHAFTDGRDTPPQSVDWYIGEIEKEFDGFEEASVSTLQGRFWLDRDRDWARTETAFELIYKGKGVEMSDWRAAVNFSYNQGKTDEFFDQYVFDKQGLIEKNDSVIFVHYRTDRLYQILKRLLDEKIENLFVTTFIEVSANFPKYHIAFPRQVINQTLSEMISKAGKKQYHLTETEKYIHLTFFLNGGREDAFIKEEWELIQSNRFIKPYYNVEPSMQSFKIAEKVIGKIAKGEDDFIIVNFANCDMVGHTGNYEAAVIAAESVDYCLGKIYEAIKDKLDEYALIVTADHGNSDIMWDYENNQPHTQHTTSPVPLILVSDIKCKLARRESLEDIAPTVLHLMGIKQPEVMTGTSLIEPV